MLQCVVECSPRAPEHGSIEKFVAMCCSASFAVRCVGGNLVAVCCRMLVLSTPA